MRQITFAEAIGEAIREEMERDPSVFVQGEDVGRYGGGYYPALKGLWERFGSERVRDFPISETVITGAAVGAALTGLRPVIDIMFMDFVFVCLDEIVNQMAKMRYMSGGTAQVPIVLRGVHGAYANLAAQHSHSPESIFCQFPGLIIVTPSCGKTAKGLMKSAIRCDDPVVFMEHKLLYTLPSAEVPPEDNFLIPLGKAQLEKEGRDVTVVANSWGIHLAVQAAQQMEKRGISVEVINLLTILPLDVDLLLKSVNKTRRLVAVQEAPPMCGIAAEIITSVMEAGISLISSPVRVTGRHAPIPFSPALESLVIPQVDDIMNAIMKAMK